MITMKNRRFCLLQAWLASLASAVSMHAQLAVYTFEPSVFVPAETTPILNRSPQPGPPGFTTSFTAGAIPNLFEIANWFAVPPISGYSLGANPNLAPAPMTVSLSSPVTAVWLGFYTLPAGRLDFVSSVGSVSAYTGQFSSVGSLFFSSAVPFSQFTLEAFDHYGNNAPLPFGVDNLQMQVIPEPDGLPIVGGLGLLGTCLLRRGRRCRSDFRG